LPFGKVYGHCSLFEFPDSNTGNPDRFGQFLKTESRNFPLSLLPANQNAHLKTLPIIRFGIIGDHQPVRHYHARCIRRGVEQVQGVAGTDVKGLLLCHLRQILHREQILRPNFLKKPPVTSIE